MRSGPKHSERRPGSRAPSPGHRPSTSIRSVRRAGRTSACGSPTSRRAPANGPSVWSTPKRFSRAPDTGTPPCGTWRSTTNTSCGSTASPRSNRRGSGSRLAGWGGPGGRPSPRCAPRGLRGAGRPLYTPSDRDVDVRVRLHPAARWVAEYYLARDVAEGPDGSLEVTLPTATTRWIARLFLRLGTDAEVLEPPGLREEIEAEAHATLERYAAASA